MPKKQELIEIARSFSQKVSNPTNRYENVDFFCSAKKEVPVEGSIEVSEQLFAFCQDEVEKSVRNYQVEHLPISVPAQTNEPTKWEKPEKLQADQDKADELEEEKIREEEKQKVEENLPIIEAEN